MYTRREGDEFLVVAVYVDDLLITRSCVKNIMKFKQQMNKEFEMTDLGKLSYYLGIKVNQGRSNTELKQSAYVKKLLEKAEMAECNSVRYPMEPKIQLYKDENGKAINST